MIKKMKAIKKTDSPVILDFGKDTVKYIDTDGQVKIYLSDESEDDIHKSRCVL